MTRQKILEETNKLMDRCYTKGSPDYPRLMVFQRQKFLNELFPLLDSLGVVIRVGRECPDISPAVECATKLGVFHITQIDMLDAGYVAVESLIEVEHD